MLGWCRFCTLGIRSLFALFLLLSHVPLPLSSYSPSSIRGLALSTAVADLLAKEAIELAPPSPGFYIRLFVTPKVTRGWRPVIDLLRLNGFVDVSHFHMETTQTVLQSLREGDCLVSLDLQDAYLQVPVHPSSRQYLRFCVGESVCQFLALCFGLRRLLRSLPASWPLSPQSCIVMASGSSGTLTIGWSWLPPSRRVFGRGIFFFGSASILGFASIFPRAR